MDLIDTQTFGFIIAFLVAFAGLVIACTKRFPNENIRRSNQKTKVPVRLEDHDKPSLRNRWLTTIQRSAKPIMSSVSTLSPRPPSSTPGAPRPPAKPRSPTPSVHPPIATPHTPTTIAPSPTTIAPTPPIMGPTAKPMAPTPTVMPPISTPPARAFTPPPLTPIQQQAHMAQQLAEEQDSVMTHDKHLKNNKYRQWVKAGLGLGYLKEGLAQFCDDIGKQQHADIIKDIQRRKNSKPNVPCGACKITTLQPDHARISKGICPLGQDNCNCCFPNYKIPCPNNVCGAIYDSIIKNHASNPPSPYWKNSDATFCFTDHWSICKCFINAPGYNDKASAVDTDCSGLLHVIINNKYFHNHIVCNVKASNNLFLEVRQYRNKIFHSSTMELEEKDANSYISEMISVLQDNKELVHHPASQQAVLKLQDLKTKDFIITTEGFGEILRQIKETAVTKDEYEELKNRITDIETQLSKENEVNPRLNIEDAAQQQQLKNEKAKSDAMKAIERMTLDSDLATNVKVVAAILVLEGDDIDRRFLEMFNKTILTLIRGIHKRKGAFPDKKEDFLNKFEELISLIEQITGAEANDGELACVIVKFICRTNEHIKKLLEYFDSDDLKYRLKEIANLITCRTKTQVNLSFRISEESLDSILQAKVVGETEEETETPVSKTMNYQKKQSKIKQA